MGMNKKIFSKQLRQVRVDSKLTGAALAEKIGLTREAIVNLESGRRSPSVDTLYDLAKTLNVSTDYLLGISSPPPPAQSVPDWVEDLLGDFRGLNKAGQESVKALVRGLRKQT
jgi:transcriptional regulator with XRE-family HTH domain